MQLEDKLNQILPPIGTKYIHITSQFGEERPNSKTHMGVDFNYIGGQTGMNLTHPKIHSPVNGKVTFVGGQFGTIKICDKQGYSHELLHLHTQRVKVGDFVTLGEEIGTMGGKGPLGHFQYPQHVHYQIKNMIGKIENPNHWWKNQLSIENVLSDNHLDVLANINTGNFSEPQHKLTEQPKEQVVFQGSGVSPEPSLLVLNHENYF